MAGPVHLNSDNFESEVLKSDVPVLVDFWATWCGPCRVIEPHVDELSHEYDGRVKVGKVNIDNDPAVATQFGIRSIPALLYFKNGEVVDTIVGAVHKDQIANKLENVLN